MCFKTLECPYQWIDTLDDSDRSYRTVPPSKQKSNQRGNLRCDAVIDS